jgi:hypothetical protein
VVVAGVTRFALVFGSVVTGLVLRGLRKMGSARRLSNTTGDILSSIAAVGAAPIGPPVS